MTLGENVLKKSLVALGLLIACGANVWAGGIDRTGQGLGALFEEGRYLEISASQVMPRVKGNDLLGGPTGDVAGNYFLPSLSLKFDVTNKLSVAFVADKTFGADILYGDGATLLGGTLVDVASHGVLGLARYRINENFSLHGGLRVQTSSATVRLKGLAYGPVGGYQVHLGPDTALSPAAGIAFEKPEIALRVAATYHAAIKHKLDTRETAPLAPLNGDSTTPISLPRAVNLDFETGIAADTLLYGGLRWVNWSEFRVDPARFVAVTGEGLIELKDTRTWTFGLARRFTDRWAGAVSVNYEGRGEPLSSPLAPVNGRRGLTLAAIHTMDKVKVTVGISYIKLGDAKLETGTPDTQRATMSGNSTVGVGAKIGWSF